MALRVEAGHGCYSRECEPEFPEGFRQGDIDSVGGLLEQASRYADKTFSSKNEANAYMRLMCNVANEGLSKLNQMPAKKSSLLDRARCFASIAVQMDKAGEAFEQKHASVKHRTKEIEQEIFSGFLSLSDLE